jgi:ABC-type glycerol-3-phosphate transport system substrate-binding protein
MKRMLLALMLLSAPATAASLQSDCRGLGTIGMAVMSADGTITLTLHSPDGAEGAVAYKKNDPQYARILSHLGGIRPGEHKPVPAFC